MPTKYTVVATFWAPGTFPNKTLRADINVKIKDLYNRGLIVSGLLVTNPTIYPSGSKLDLVNHSQANTGDGFDTYTEEDLLCGPVAMNLTHTFDTATGTVHTVIDKTVPVKELRLFTSVAGADEYINHVLSLGAQGAEILTEEQYKTVITLPDDSVIDQHVKV